jgi:DNA modification methylase
MQSGRKRNGTRTSAFGSPGRVSHDFTPFYASKLYEGLGKCGDEHRKSHPAPFPVELPQRLIRLYTFEGEVVLDPFMGSGQTAIAAIKANRRWVGYEIDKKYARLAKTRIRKAVLQLSDVTLFDQGKNEED